MNLGVELASACGVKCARLLELASDAETSAIALPVFPFIPDAARIFAQEHADREHAALVREYADDLRQREPGLAAQVAAECGPGPWVVRSSGDEDTETNINAGGYSSLVCHDPARLPEIVAAVVFSGYSPEALAQQRIVDPDHRPRPIAAFAQPLITADGSAEPGEAPLLAPSDVAEIAGWIRLLHHRLDMSTMDTEWVLRTDAGLVSGTALTRLVDGSLTGRLALGFGFGGAQKVSGTDNSVLLLAEGPDGAFLPLWEGDLLRRVVVARWWTVQARPAPGYDPRPRVEVLTADSRERWQRTGPLEVEIVVPPPAIAPADFLSATTVDDAWSAYLGLGPGERDHVRYVFVEHGSAEEHAGLMFRQCGVAVLRTRLTDIPRAAGFAFVDPWTESCYFGDGEAAVAAAAVRTETREVLAVPARTRLLVERADVRPADRRPVDESDLPGGDRLRALRGLPPLALAGILRRSTLPGDGHVRDAGGVASPAFTARLAEELVAAGADGTALAAVLPPPAMPYARAVLAARGGVDVSTVLPRISVVAPGSAASLVAEPDLRIALALVEAEAGPLSDAVLGAVVEAAVAAPVEVLSATACLVRQADDLAIYRDEERDAIVERFVRGLPADPRLVCELVRSSSLAPAETVDLVAVAAADPDLAAAYDALLSAMRQYSASATLSSAAAAGEKLNRAYDAVDALVRQDSRIRHVLDLIRCDLVEVYDAGAKAVLLTLVDFPDPARYRVYLDGLSAWLDLAGSFELDARERAAVEAFRGWIARWRSEPPVTDYVIDEHVPWEIVLDRRERPPNPHHLHNTVHQWLLARVGRFPVDRAPSRLAGLHEFSDRFCQGGPKLLRLGGDGFELEIPLSVHKASLLFRPGVVEVEWAEQPGVPNTEIARLVAFELVLRRFEQWFPDVGFTTDRVCLAGTWTLRIRARRPGGERLGIGAMRAALVRLRTLFDMSFDFAYIPNDEVADLTFDEPGWPEVFTAIFALREATDDTDQYEMVEALPLGTFFTGLCLHARTRAAVLAAVNSGPEAAVDEFLRRRRELDAETDPEVWGDGHFGVGHLGVAIAALWPGAALAAVREHPGTDELAATVLRRRDLREEIRADPALRDAALRHAPHVVLTADNAEATARDLLATPKAHRRAKQYLVHRFADHLDAATLFGLVTELEVVPLGFSDSQEDVLRRCIGEVGHRRRVPIRRFLDETALHVGKVAKNRG